MDLILDITYLMHILCCVGTFLCGPACFNYRESTVAQIILMLPVFSFSQRFDEHFVLE